jgi:DNA-binding NarL/FixJ family response regulator
MQVGETNIIIQNDRSFAYQHPAADDHPLIRAGPVNFLATEPELHVVAEAANGKEALEKYRELRPDIVQMDLSMPVMEGVSATRAILDLIVLTRPPMPVTRTSTGRLTREPRAIS